MLIECPNCSVQYEVESADALVGRKVRCTECAHVWRPIPFAPGESPPPPPAGAEPKSDVAAATSEAAADARAQRDDRAEAAAARFPSAQAPATEAAAESPSEAPGEAKADGSEPEGPAHGAPAPEAQSAPAPEAQSAPAPEAHVAPAPEEPAQSAPVPLAQSAPASPPPTVAQTPSAVPASPAATAAPAEPAGAPRSAAPDQPAAQSRTNDPAPPPAPPSPPAPQSPAPPAPVSQVAKAADGPAERTRAVNRPEAPANEEPPAPPRKPAPQAAPADSRQARHEAPGQQAAAPLPAPRAGPAAPAAAAHHDRDDEPAAPQRPGPRPAPPRPALAGHEPGQEYSQEPHQEPDDEPRQEPGDDWPSPATNDPAPRFERPRGPRLAERAANARAVQARANGIAVHRDEADRNEEDFEDAWSRASRSGAGMAPSEIVPTRLEADHPRAAPHGQAGRAHRRREPLEPDQPMPDDGINDQPSARSPAGARAGAPGARSSQQRDYPTGPELEGPPFGGDFEVDDDFGPNARILGQTGRSGSRRSPLAVVALSLAWLALIAVAGGASTLIALYPDEVTERFPGMRKFYSAAGLSVAPTSDLQVGALKVRWHRAVETGVAVVQGRLVNVTSAAIASPTLEFLVRDEAGKPVSSWVQRLDNFTIPAGKGAPFALRIPVPPGIAHSVDVRLAPTG